MLIAFSFPEDDYRRLFNIASGLLKKNNIEHEAQWPHVSVLSANNIKDADKTEIKEALKNKPEFKTLGWGILNGQVKDFLVLLLDSPKEYMDAYQFIKEKFGVVPYQAPKPHVSLLSFKKSDKDRVADLIPLISQKTEGKIPSNIKSSYIQFWDKVDPTEGADVIVRGKNFKDIEDKEYQITDVTESKKKKKKRKTTALAPFYGRGDGRSGATVPPFRAPTNGPTPRLGPSLPSPVTGMNAPQFGTLPAAPMVAWRDEIATLFESNFHVCFVCSGKRVMENKVACPLCAQMNSIEVSPFETCVDGGNADNTGNFMGFDVPWDLR